MSVSDSLPPLHSEELARQRRVARLLVLLDLHLATQHAADDHELADPLTLLRLKRTWYDGTDFVRRWRELSKDDPVFRRRPASPHTCALAETSLDAQLQVLFHFDVARSERATR